MKTEIKYEVSDVNIENNAAHKFLYSQLVIANLMFAITAPSFKDASKEKLEEEMKKTVALFLTQMSLEGWELVRKESIPQVIRDGMSIDKT